MKLTRILFITLLLFCSIGLSSQSWMDFTAETNDFQAIIEKAEAYFERVGKGRGTGYKQFMRWKGSTENQVGTDGLLKNTSALNFAAYRQAQRMVSRSGERNTHGHWSDLGPFDYYVSNAGSQGGIGRVQQIEFHPSNSNIIWIGTSAGGIWKSTDGGSTWSPKGDDLPSMGVVDIKFNHINPNLMYILTGDGYKGHTNSIGLLMSIDGGETWDTTGLSYEIPWSVRPYVLTMDPVVPSRLHIGLRGGGLIRSTDGGETWTNNLVGSGWMTVWDIKYEPSDPNIMYAATSQGLYRSLNGGQNWSQEPDSDFPSGFNSDNEATTYEKMDLAVSPSAPGVVYVIFGGRQGPNGGVNGFFYGLFRSTDYGNDFTLQSVGPNILGWATDGMDNDDQAWRNMEMVIDPTNSDVVYVGGINVWKSTNAGDDWERLTYWSRIDPEPYVHADFVELHFEGNTLWATNDGGVYFTNDGGGSWTEVSSGLSITQYYEIDVLNNKYMGGSQDNGTTEGEYPNTQFHGILGGDGFAGVWHTGNNSIQYVSTQNSIVRRQPCCCVEHDINPDGLGSGDFWFCEIEMHTTNPDYVFLATKDELYRGNGDCFSFSWDSMGTNATLVNNIRDFVQGTDDPNVMYVSSKNIVLKTSNLGSATPTWSPLQVTLIAGADATDVEVDPGNSNRVWVGMAGYQAGKKVYYSPDGGSTWQNISGSLPNTPVNSLSYGTGNGAGIYAGTDIGVFFKGDGMSDWIYFSNGFPNVRVLDMEIEDGYIYAGTFGRGIWRSPVYTNCPGILALTPGNQPGSAVGIQYYHASNQITSTRIIDGGFATKVFYQAGNRIDLLPGFEGRSGNFMEAKIGGCPD